VTAALLALLARLEGAVRAVLESPSSEAGDKLCTNVLSKQAPSGTPLILTLSNGVNSYLDCAEAVSRACGMRVAKKFSSMMGMQSAFAEVDAQLGGDAGGCTSSQAAQLDSPAANARSSSTSAGPGSALSAADAGLSDDSEDDLEPLDLTEPPSTVAVAATVYLRACLDMLRMDPAANGAADKQDAALTHLTRILETQPADGPLLAGTLTRTIINIGNHFNLDFFDDRRTAAMQALLRLYPYQAVPEVSELVRAQDAVLGTRVWAVSQLASAAHGLSGVPMPAVPATRAALSPSPASGTGSPTATVTATASAINTNPKTVMKRPLRHAMLAGQVQRQKAAARRGGQRNPIMPMLDMFIVPLLAVLGTGVEERGLRVSMQMQVSPPPAPSGIIMGSSVELPRVGAIDGGVEDISSIRNNRNRNKVNAVLMADDASVGGGAGELDALLIAEALMTLSSVARCAHNTPMQRRLIEISVTLSRQYMNSTYLVVRRAALGAASVVIDAWALQRQEQKQTQRAAGVGGSALQTLSDLAGRTASRVQVPNALVDGDLGLQVTALVDSCMEGLRADPDALSRALKTGLARAVLALDEDEETSGEFAV